jgi:hypothetical protein
VNITYDVALFIALPLIMNYIILPLIVSFSIGNLISGIYGFWYLDALLCSNSPTWFKVISIALVLILNGRGYKDGGDLDNRSTAIGWFSLGFLVAIVKYFFF